MSHVEQLVIWTVFRYPRDFPGFYVVRASDIEPNLCTPRQVGCLCRTLEEARESVPLGLHNIGRHPTDDNSILESWI